MKRIFYIILLANFFISCEKPISEFQSENFIKMYGSGYESKGYDVIELAEGGYVITGYDKINGIDYQVYIAKIDKNGNLIWEKKYGRIDCLEMGKVVKETSDGFIIAGTSLPNSSSITHSFIMKIGAEGDSISYKEFGDATYSIYVNDMIISGGNIYIAGQSNESDVTKTAFYRAKLDLSGNTSFGKSNFKSTNSAYERVFSTEDGNLLFTGTYGINNLLAVSSIISSTMSEANSFNSTTNNEVMADASFNNNKLYMLATVSSSKVKLCRYNTNFTEEWHTDLIDGVIGKSVANNADGTLMICGESTVDGNQVINFIKVKEDGSTEYGVQFFKTFPGTVGKLTATKDNGLILIGSTNSTYGVNIQLIKTDKDYFMLKN